MPLQATSGAASYDAFGGGVAAVPNYIESCFSSWLYMGNGSTQTITNGIDLAGEGGLVWIKSRSTTNSHRIFDTARGVHKFLNSSDTGAQATNTSTLTAFNSTGFDIGSSSVINTNAESMASWTFREQPKFYTQELISHTNGTATNIDLSTLGTVGYLHAKITNTTGDWIVWHRSLTAGNNLRLNTTAAQSTTNAWLSVSGTTATLSASAPTGSYIVHAFAHDAGGFGLSGTDNVISCGSCVTDGSGYATVNLGYEPQFVLVKRSSATGDWYLHDVMRNNNSASYYALRPNLSNAEMVGGAVLAPLASTGFTLADNPSSTYIYIAIRRGPMKTPTSGTSVFSAKTYSATTSSAQVTHDVTFDAEINANRDYNGGAKFLIVDSLRGINGTAMWTANTGAEASYPTYWSRKDQRTMYAPSAFDQWWASNSGTQGHISYGLVRAPGFFDEVCYTGNDVLRTITHNLGVAPEMMIIKCRDSALDWAVYHAGIGNTKYLFLNSTAAEATASSYWNNTSPTASVFTINTTNKVNSAPSPYVAYLFASAPGVSKVGSYTGNGSSQTINCGFTGGARFVLIKKTSGTGSWYVWDSARGIVAGNDPYLLLNSTAAEVTSTDYVDTYSAGFEISSTAPSEINENGGSFIFFAVA